MDLSSSLSQHRAASARRLSLLAAALELEQTAP